MGPDCYKVEVLHFINPHLIWVEAVNKSGGSFVFEQVGIYGILPLDTTIDVDGTLQTHRCEEWVSTVAVLMKKLLLDAYEVWFCPIFIDRRSSIFDENVHKFGDLIIKKNNGKEKSLATHLNKSGFALYDDCEFHKELSGGKLKTKLNRTKTFEVISQLENYYKKKEDGKRWEESIKNQTTVFKTAQHLEMVLTVKNVEDHNKKIMSPILENKLRDFEMCKDINDQSVGRAASIKSVGSSMLQNPLLKKKLDLFNQYTTQDTADVFSATKKYLETNAVKKKANIKNPVDNNEDALADNFASIESIMIDQKENDVPDQKDNDVGDQKDNDVRDQKVNDVPDQKVNDVPDQKVNDVPDQKVNDVPDQKVNDVPDQKDNDVLKISVKRAKKSKAANKLLEYDIQNELRIAYGPPEVTKTLLPLKVVRREDFERNLNMKDVMDNKFDARSEAREDNANSNEFSNNDVPNTKENYVPEVSTQNTGNKGMSKLLLRTSAIHEDLVSQQVSSTTSNSDTANKDLSDETTKETAANVENNSDDEYFEPIESYNFSKIYSDIKRNDVSDLNYRDTEIFVNPFKNLEGSTSVFVDKLVSPVLMVHSKRNYRILPRCNIKDVPFGTQIHVVLRNLNVKEPTRLQSVSWSVILRGHSVFLVSPLGSGKTMGYLPSVCRLVSDCSIDSESVGPSCIVVCATAKAALDVSNLAKMFLGLHEKVICFYSGMDELSIATSLLNGCDLLVCTPSVLAKLLNTEIGIDLRRLSTFVLDDCERLSKVYSNEIKFYFYKIKEMLKSRIHKELKVQFIIVSRVWCNFMESLARKAPDTVICIGAFQECVLYSKSNTTVDFVKKENKLNAVTSFIEDIDSTKKTVIVCRTDDEVYLLTDTLTKLNYVVFSCDNTMTVQDLYNLNKAFAEYQEPLLGPILICCDDNLTHMNVIDAFHLLHYSMPKFFSMFCKRFSVLIDNYASVFKTDNSNVRIKVLLDDSNVEQLPKILNFVNRCSYDIPETLDKICKKVLIEKDVMKGKSLVPICDNVLALGECPDFWNCEERHTIHKEFDQPLEWVPKDGTITFKILHYHTAVLYSVRLISHLNGAVKKYPQTYSTLSLKMGMYYSKELNKRLHGVPKLGDVCAVSIKPNYFVRCQVVKILNHYPNGNPNYVLIKLIDEEKYERTRDIYLHYLPDELRNIETYVIQVRLANIQPKDGDVTFSDLAKDQLKMVTDKDDHLYLRGQIALTVGNCILVDTLEACQDLSSLSETVVRHDFKKDLFEKHAVLKIDHIKLLETLCPGISSKSKDEKTKDVVELPLKTLPKGRWAHLENNDFSSVFLASAENVNQFYVRLVKFKDCMISLIQDIKKHVEANAQPLRDFNIDDIVLAKFPDDSTYERARIDNIIDENKVKCFFVDQGDWRDVDAKDLIPITEKLINQLPFQAIECRLIGVQPAGENWTEFSTNWFWDRCFDNSDNLKHMFIKYFTKESAECTDGYKYGIVMVDTYPETEVVINKLMIQLNLAQEIEEETKYLEEFEFKKESSSQNSDDEYSDDKEIIDGNVNNNSNVVALPTEPVFSPGKPIRSMPLVNVKDDMYNIDKWDFNMSNDFTSMVVDDMKKKSQTVIKEVVDNDEVLNNTNESLNVKGGTENSCNDVKNELKSVVEDSMHSDKNNSISNENTSHIALEELRPKSNEKGERLIELTSLRKNNVTLDSDDLSLTSHSTDKSDSLLIKNYELRKPKLVWRQNKNSVSIKIQLIGVDDYELIVEDKSLKFRTELCDTSYGFDFELYGVVDIKNCSHSNKGQYILVKLVKIMKRNWLSLTKENCAKWIVYDVDSIDTSSDEESAVDTSMMEAVRSIHNKVESDSDEDLEFDDVNFSYKKH